MPSQGTWWLHWHKACLRTMHPPNSQQRPLQKRCIAVNNQKLTAVISTARANAICSTTAGGTARRDQASTEDSPWQGKQASQPRVEAASMLSIKCSYMKGGKCSRVCQLWSQVSSASQSIKWHQGHALLFACVPQDTMSHTVHCHVRCAQARIYQTASVVWARANNASKARALTAQAGSGGLCKRYNKPTTQVINQGNLQGTPHTTMNTLSGFSGPHAAQQTRHRCPGCQP